MRPPLRQRLRGFTIVELLLVLVVLGLLMSLALPRLTTIERRRTQLNIEELFDLVGMFAYRDSLRVQRVGLWHDSSTETYQLLIHDVDPDRPEDPPEWRPDRFVNPVRLAPGVAIVDLLVDGRRQNIRDDWLVNGAVRDFRPRIQLDLDTDEGPVSIVLEPDSLQPVRIGAGVDESNARTSIDLDAVGRDREAW
jgi:prepilin-type N-terminal cleavage/methylation domain-containing protein